MRIQLRKAREDDPKQYLRKGVSLFSQSSGNKTHQRLGYLGPCEYMVLLRVIREGKEEGRGSAGVCGRGVQKVVAGCECEYACVNMIETYYVHV